MHSSLIVLFNLRLVNSCGSDKAGADQLQNAIQALGRKSIALHADFSQEEGVESFFQEAIDFLGSVDILVNNAGGYDTSPFLDLSYDTFNHVQKISLCAPMRLTQLAAKTMIDRKQQGVILNISSISGLRPYPHRVAHSAAKAGVNMLTQSTALELAPHGIRVNAIAPGPVPYEPEDLPAPEIPLGRRGTPEDIAKAALFLVSEEASWITGQILTIDGGLSLSLIPSERLHF
jgi:NAD(P)-dependent dehydrogenase (short-subunit alcohol dehydrogenase family)